MDESDDNTSAADSDVEANNQAAVSQLADNVDDAVDSDVEANRAFFQSDYIDYYVEMDDVSSDVEANYNQAVFQDDNVDDAAAVDSDNDTVEVYRDIFPATYVGDDVDSDVESDIEANRDVFPSTYVGDTVDSDLEANRYIFPVAYIGDADDSDEEANHDVFPDTYVGDDAFDRDMEASNRDLFPASYIVERDVRRGVDYYVEMVEDNNDELARGSDDDNNDVAGEVGGIIIEEIENADADAVEADNAGEGCDYIVEEIEDADDDEVEAENDGEDDDSIVEEIEDADADEVDAENAGEVEGRSSATTTDDDVGGFIGSVRDIFCSQHSPYPFMHRSVLWDLETPSLEKCWSSSWRMDRAVVNHSMRMRYINSAHKFALKIGIQMNRKMDTLLFAWNNSLTLWKFDKEVQKVQAAVAYGGRDTPVPRYKKLFDEEERWDFLKKLFWGQLITKSQRFTDDASSLCIRLESGTGAALKLPFCFDGWDRKKEDPPQHEPFRTFGSSLIPRSGHCFPPKLLCSNVTRQPLRKNIILTCAAKWLCVWAKRGSRARII